MLLLMEEMQPKICKWQKRNKNNNEHNFANDVAGVGGHVVLSAGRGGQNLKWSYATADSFAAQY